VVLQFHSLGEFISSAEVEVPPAKAWWCPGEKSVLL
jgi:hypothetical protein